VLLPRRRIGQRWGATRAPLRILKKGDTPAGTIHRPSENQGDKPVRYLLKGPAVWFNHLQRLRLTGWGRIQLRAFLEDGYQLVTAESFCFPAGYNKPGYMRKASQVTRDFHYFPGGPS